MRKRILDRDVCRGPGITEDEIIRDNAVDGRVPLDVRVAGVVVDEEGYSGREEGLCRAAGDEVGVFGDRG